MDLVNDELKTRGILDFIDNDWNRPILTTVSYKFVNPCRFGFIDLINLQCKCEFYFSDI